MFGSAIKKIDLDSGFKLNECRVIYNWITSLKIELNNFNIKITATNSDSNGK